MNCLMCGNDCSNHHLHYGPCTEFYCEPCAKKGDHPSAVVLRAERDRLRARVKELEEAGKFVLASLREVMSPRTWEPDEEFSFVRIVAIERLRAALTTDTPRDASGRET